MAELKYNKPFCSLDHVLAEIERLARIYEIDEVEWALEATSIGWIFVKLSARINEMWFYQRAQLSASTMLKGTKPEAHATTVIDRMFTEVRIKAQNGPKEDGGVS